MQHYIICYDITNPKRLVRVHRVLKKTAIPLQYSVFSGYLKQREVSLLKQRLESIISPKEDDIRWYPVAKNHAIEYRGIKPLPDDVFMSQFR